MFPRFGMDVDERSLQDGLKFLDRFLPVLEKQLGQCEYLAGDALTLADFNLVATLDPAELSEIDLSAYPVLKTYRDRLMAEAFYQKCFAKYSDCFDLAAG
jgi:glutathione S-transferase